MLQRTSVQKKTLFRPPFCHGVLGAPVTVGTQPKRFAEPKVEVHRGRADPAQAGVPFLLGLEVVLPGITDGAGGGTVPQVSARLRTAAVNETACSFYGWR